MKNGGYVYIMASGRMGTIYIGSSSDLIGRVFEHKNKVYPKSFTAKYNCDKLVYFEYHERLDDMVLRERRLKEWPRNWKIKLIIDKNPNWHDLYPELLDANGFSAE